MNFIMPNSYIRTKSLQKRKVIDFVLTFTNFDHYSIYIWLSMPY